MMRTTISAGCTLLFTLGLLPAEARGQSVQGELESLAVDNAELYLDPIATGFGVALGSGFAQSAVPHQPLGFDLGIRVMGAFVPDTERSFLPALPTSVTYDGQEYQQAPYTYQGDGSGRTPTAAGEGAGVVVSPNGAFRSAIENAGEDPADYDLAFPDGFDVPAVPFAIIQGSLGVGAGTDLTLRLIPAYEVDTEVGEISALGFGIKHSIDQWLPGTFPVDLAALAGWQTFGVGDYLDASALNLGLIASRGLGPLTLFTTGSYESSALDVSYTVRNPEGNPGLPADGATYGFSYESEGSARGAAGIALKLLLLDVSAEYALGTYNTASVKAGISFR